MCANNKQKIRVKILKNQEIAKDVYKMTLLLPEIVKASKPGQFINVYLNDASKLLPRPISICEVDQDSGILTLVYAVFGEGTKIISGYQSGDLIEVMGPFGNGYALMSGKTQLLIGGGVGTPPLVELAKQLTGEVIAVIGFKSEPYLVEELERFCTVYVATDDGSFGYHGTVLELIKHENITADQIYTCGPKPMLRALQGYALENNIPTQMSLEERMGCGFGACVGCVVAVHSDNEAGYSYKKVCKDGPVFDAKEVILA